MFAVFANIISTLFKHPTNDDFSFHVDDQVDKHKKKNSTSVQWKNCFQNASWSSAMRVQPNGCSYRLTTGKKSSLIR